MAKPKFKTVDVDELLDDGFDEGFSVGEILDTSRGERRSTPRHSGDYRRSNRYVEDGYGEGDFA
jgi:hypothetical protein